MSVVEFSNLLHHVSAQKVSDFGAVWILGFWINNNLKKPFLKLNFFFLNFTVPRSLELARQVLYH
jgi:hypothetical protein